MKATVHLKSFHGHAGIPGHQGGSAPKGASGGMSEENKRKWDARQAASKRAVDEHYAYYDKRALEDLKKTVIDEYSDAYPDMTHRIGDSDGKITYSVRNFGRWVSSSNSQLAHDEDYDVLSSGSKSDLQSIINAFSSAFPKAKLNVDVGEKHWIHFRIG